MGYLDIVKQALRVTNRNLLAILVQILYVVAILAVLAVFAVILIAMFAGTLAGLGDAASSPEKLLEVLGSSFSLILTGMLFVLLFVFIVALMNAVVQSGILGCLIGTARGGAPGFSSDGFFSSVRASAWPLFWMHLLFSLIGLGVFLVLGIVAAVGVGGILLPLKDAGNQVAAFAIGVPFFVLLIIVCLVALFLLYAGGMFAGISLVGEKRGASSAIGAAYVFIVSRFWDAMLFTLLVMFIIISANVVIQFISLPFDIASQSNIMGALVFLPLVFVTMLLKMYVGLFAQSCFVVYYTAATTPPATPGAQPSPGTGQGTDEHVIEAELIEPESEDRPDTAEDLPESTETERGDTGRREDDGPDVGPDDRTSWGRRHGE